MANPQDEIDALKAQIAALTARVYQVEQESRIASEAESEAPAALPAGTMLQSPSPQIGSGPSPFGWPPPPRQPSTQPQPNLRPAISKQDADLEKKIGQYWLNRIGIVAMLIGVSYFLKFAFENNWIGPGGRIVIGLLAGIGLLVWSERFRGRGYAAFSYSLKAVGIGTL